jgi:hypothetical protein
MILSEHLAIVLLSLPAENTDLSAFETGDLNLSIRVVYCSLKTHWKKKYNNLKGEA